MLPFPNGKCCLLRWCRRVSPQGRVLRSFKALRESLRRVDRARCLEVLVLVYFVAWPKVSGACGGPLMYAMAIGRPVATLVAPIQGSSLARLQGVTKLDLSQPWLDLFPQMDCGFMQIRGRWTRWKQEWSRILQSNSCAGAAFVFLLFNMGP